jgi:aryl-alcohol dehydrogenase-like predicted oxidoreductase
LTRPTDIVRMSTLSLQGGRAEICTENEEEVGRAIRESGVPRSEIFVTTKLYAFHPEARCPWRC